jgi:hypothetical protein
MKRKAPDLGDLPPKKRKASEDQAKIQAAFRPDLFEPSTRETFWDGYRRSKPYPHAVVPSLIQDDLLRSV